MLNPRDIRKRLEQVVSARLQPGGFRCKRGFFIKEKSSEIQHWIALPHNIPDKNGPVYFAANIGIRVRPLHQLLEQIGYSRGGQLTPVFTINVGYLAPDKRWTEWPFVRSAFSDDSAEHLGQHIIRYGLPFQESFTDLRRVYAGCQKYGIKDYNRVRLPVLRFVMGEPAEAVHDARRALEEYSGVEHAYAQHLRCSLEKFLEYAHTNAA